MNISTVASIPQTALTRGLAVAVAGSSLTQWLQVVLLGIVEGLTEFLPVSSTGHLVVTSALLGFEGSIGGTFEIFIQLGAILAVVGFYMRDILAQASDVLGRPREGGNPAEARRFWIHIVIAVVPAVAIGLPLHDWIKAALFQPVVIAITLFLGGVTFIIVERALKRAASTTAIFQITLKQALTIGFAQTLALVPGVSRSGATIIGGLLVGLDRSTATAFTFYLAIPTLGGATLVDLLGSLDLLSASDVARLAVGTAVSFGVAWFSIGWLLRYVSRNTFIPFGIYRILAGCALFVLVGLGIFQ